MNMRFWGVLFTLIGGWCLAWPSMAQQLPPKNNQTDARPPLPPAIPPTDMNGSSGSFVPPPVPPAKIDKNKEPTKFHILEEGKSAEAKEALLERLETYWTHYNKGDWLTIYPMYVQEFRDRRTMLEFAKTKRGHLNDYTIAEVSFWGDECAFVKVYLNMTTEVMNISKLPIRHYWTLRDGVWQLFDDPYRSQSGFARISHEKIEPPCTLPKKAATVDSTVTKTANKDGAGN